MIRGGIDIGGTFTDIVYIDDETGKISSHKILTTPHNPAVGVINGVLESGVDLAKVWLLVHGTTIVINAIISHSGAKTALITTDGYRDLLEIGRGNRLVSFDIYYRKPEPLIPRRWRFSVSERMDWRGKVIVKLRLEEVQKVLDHLVKEGVESIAVCFLHSYANSKHEEEVKKFMESRYKNVQVTLSTEVLPEIREFERLSTTVVSAYTKPVAKNYIDELEGSLKRRGYPSELYLMQSNAGLINSETAKTSPVQIIESGPVGGVVACKYLGDLMGYKDIAVFDMGGTTSKAGLIINGNISVTRDYLPAGYPVRIPVADMIELGVGGGSISWIDEAGFLKVGPMSAGASPGPICYDLGGVEPTISDANLVLGRIRSLLKGKTKLNREKARNSIIQKIAVPLGLDLIGAANGIIEIAVSMLVDEFRAVSISKGIDLRDFVMFAFGGAGPMHCAFILRELELKGIIIPSAAGAFSALGFLCSDLRHDFVKTRIMKTTEMDLTIVGKIFSDLEEKGFNTLQTEGVARKDIIIEKSVDMRYVGQAYELNIPFASEEKSLPIPETLIRRFNESYKNYYGHSTPEEPTEIINFRAAAIGKVKKPPILENKSLKEAPLPSKGKVYFKETGSVICPFYDREDLSYGSKIQGPGIIEELTSTTVIPPDFEAEIDTYLNIVIRRCKR
jgi:N-methylhydantoinase A